jgi:hypothetical protein
MDPSDRIRLHRRRLLKSAGMAGGAHALSGLGVARSTGGPVQSDEPEMIELSEIFSRLFSRITDHLVGRWKRFWIRVATWRRTS